MSLPITRIAAIRAKTPSEARIARFMEQACGIRALAIELAHADHIAWAEAQQARTTWNSTPARRGRKGIVPFAECLTPDQARLAGAGIAPLDHRPQDQADCLHLADFYSNSGAPRAGEGAAMPPAAPSSSSSQRKAA